MLKLLEDLQSNEITLSTLHEKYGIDIREYEDRYVLNYNQIKSYSYKFDPIVRVCRQLIISRDFSKVLHRSFDRFYNYSEDPNTDKFDISKAICEQKLDGSLIGIYHDGEKWCHCSKSMAYAEGNLSNNTRYRTFGELIDNEIDLSPIYENGNKNYSYLFELMSEYDNHVKKVRGTKIYLLAIRNKETGEYIDKYEEGRRIGYSALKDDFPVEFKFKSLDDILNDIKLMDKEEEGYVCRIGDWRVKLKNPLHVAMSHFISSCLTERKVIEIVYKCEEEEFLSYNNEKREIFQPWIDARNRMKDYFDSLYRNHYSEDRATFGKSISTLPKPFRSILFNMLDANGNFQEAYDKIRISSVEGVFKELVKI